MKEISMKTFYLLGLISFGLIALGVGSTYAIFSASSEINNPITIATTLASDSDIIEAVDVIVPAGEVVVKAVTINNNSSSKVNYAIWYLDNIDETTTIGIKTSSDTSAGSVNASSSVTKNIVIRNASTNDITVTLGVATNTGNISLEGDMEIVPNTVTSTETNKYSLTLTKGTGVSTIYYKVNGASSYSSTTSTKTLDVIVGTTYYYYGIASTGYSLSTCTESNPCSGTMTASAVSKSLVGTVNKYDLTLTKGTGISTIYYKINGATSYSSTTSTKTLSVQYNSQYYYYAVPSTGYVMSTCSKSSPCNGIMGTTALTKTLNATAGYTITIKKSISNGTPTLVETATVLSGGSYSTTITGGSYYVFDSVSCDNGQATVTEIYNQNQVVNFGFSISNVTANTTCIVYIID